MTPSTRRRLMTLLLVAVSTLLTSCDARPRTGFSGERALEHVRTQLAFGPRVPGSEGHRRTGDWIAQQIRALADTVVEQRWNHVTIAGDTLPLRNIFARFRPDEPQRILFLAHWDTRPVADDSPILGDRVKPVPGANDGASGVALLLAVAEVLKKTPPQYGVDLLFVDGEDYGNFSRDEDVLLGSKYFAQHLPSADYRPLFGVLWDMIGDADLRIQQEAISVQQAPEVVSRVWATASDMGYANVFVGEVGDAVTDDHVPLLRAGLRVIDVIDLHYVEPSGPRNYHHTIHDTIDKVSAKSLQIVGDVAVGLVTAR